MNDGQELVDKPETAIQPFDEYEAEIVQFEKYFDNKKYDLATEEGMDLCEGDKLLLRKVEIRIDKTRKERGKSLRDAVTTLNECAKVWHNRVHAMWEVIDEPLAKIRQAKLDAEIDKHEKEQAELKAIEDKRLADLKAREDAAAAKEAELKAIEDTLNAGQHAADIKEAARIAAENAIAEERRIANQKETDRIAAELAEKNRLAEIERKRLADVEHQKEFNNLALDAIVAVTGDPASSLRLVKAIATGKIPNVKMIY